jgi:dihydrofolate reductase
MILSIISAIGKNNEIGKGNSLLWNLPLDMKHFRETTTGHPIIMGQKTFESIGKPLPSRRNIVLTLDKDFKRDDLEVFYSIEDLEKNLNETLKENDEAFIIGGGMIYKLFIDKADRLYITHVKESFKDADTFFPIIDKDKWIKISENIHSKDESNNYDLSFAIYTKK